MSGDSYLSRVEFESFLKKVSKHPECRYPTTPCGLETFLKRKNSSSNWEISNCTTVTPVIRVFMENSDSMDGYLRGGKSFRDNLAHLLVRLKSMSSGSEYNFINASIFPVKQTLEGFIKEMSPPSSYYFKYKSSTFGSDLNSLFRRIIQNMKDDEIAVFITDGIYSIANSENIQTELLGAKNLTMDTFIDGVRKNNLVTVILQLEAGFEGSYYDMKHTPHPIRGQKPFYVFLFGSETTLLPLWIEKKAELLKNPGLKNYMLFYKDIPSEVPVVLLSQYKKIGKKKILDRRKNIIGSVVPDSDGRFSVSMVVDLGGLREDKKIAEDPNNYTLMDTCKLEVGQYQESTLDANDKIFLKKFVGNPTHILDLICGRDVLKKERITITLERTKRTPWWHNSSLSNDIPPATWSEFKTFGLSYLIDGISDAYGEFATTELIFSIPIFLENQ